MSKYEQLIEYIINEQEDKARELFHQIVVEKSREIYENLIDEEDIDEVQTDSMQSLSDEIDADEQGMVEADDEDDMDMPVGDMEMDTDMGDDDMGDDDMEMDAGMGDDDMEGGEELEDRVMDLEAALDELKAEFDKLMADEMDEPEHADMDAPKESMVREYVDKVATPSNAEGQTVGAQSSSKPTVNTKSPNGPGANMGGHANLAKGGAEQAPDGKPIPQPNNQYAKGKGNLPHAGQFENVPGAKTKGYTTKAGAKHNEGSTTDGSLAVAKHSPVAK